MLNAALLTTNDQSAWLAALDHADVWSLDTVATPNRIDDDATAQDCGVARYAEIYEAVGATYKDDNGNEIAVEPVAGSYSIHPDHSVSFSYLVSEDVITIQTIPTASSAESGVKVYKLSDENEGKEICVSTEFDPNNATLLKDLKSDVTDYVASREGQYNDLMITPAIDPATGDKLKLSRRDAAVMFTYLKAAAGTDSKRKVIPLYDDINIIVHPPTPTLHLKDIAQHYRC